jgi:hypothetical protein
MEVSRNEAIGSELKTVGGKKGVAKTLLESVSKS